MDTLVKSLAKLAKWPPTDGGALSEKRRKHPPGRRAIETLRGEVRHAETFGAVLGKLIHDRSTISALAVAINVDKSIVYRWRRNERVPQLNAGYVDKIANALGLTSWERERLRRAQVASLSEQRLPPSRSPKHASASRKAVDRLLARSTSPSSEPMSASMKRGPTARRPRGTDIVHGRAELIAEAIEILRAVPEPTTQSAEILLSVLGGKVFAGVEGEAELYAAWQQALRGVLMRGWQVSQLWRLDRDITRTLTLVGTMLNLVGSGRYHPRYFERYGLLRPPYDVVIVPPNTALLMFSTAGTEVVDAGWVERDEERVAMLARHFEQLRLHTRPLLQEFRPHMQELELTRALAAAESRPGGRLLIKNGLSALTDPPAWWRADSLFLDYVVRSSFVRRADLPAYQTALERRWRSFTRRVREFEFHDVCPVSVIERMAAGAEYLRPDDPQSGFNVPLEQRLDHLRHVAEMVRTYPNYRLALLDRREERLLSIEPARSIDGDHDAFISTVSPDERGEMVRVDVHITEGTIVWALREHFDSLWERIAEQHHEPGYVLNILEKQIALLEQRVGQPVGLR